MRAELFGFLLCLPCGAAKALLDRKTKTPTCCRALSGPAAPRPVAPGQGSGRGAPRAHPSSPPLPELGDAPGTGGEGGGSAARRPRGRPLLFSAGLSALPPPSPHSSAGPRGSALRPRPAPAPRRRRGSCGAAGSGERGPAPPIGLRRGPAGAAMEAGKMVSASSSSSSSAGPAAVRGSSGRGGAGGVLPGAALRGDAVPARRGAVLPSVSPGTLRFCCALSAL